MTPTHFFVSLNESKDLSKTDIETMTYSFCYMYSNWSGSIKVPAPCQYGHKIAEYHTGFVTDKRDLERENIRVKKLGYSEEFTTSGYFL